MRRFSLDDRRRRLAYRHRLVPEERTDSIAGVADSLVALHSSDPATVYLSATARMTEPSVEAVAQALYVDRTVVRHHAMRRTLWVMTPRVRSIAHAATTAGYIDKERTRTAGLLEARTAVEDGETWLAGAQSRVLEVLRDQGTASTRELGELLPDLKIGFELAPGKRYNATASALSRVLLQLGFEGRITRVEPAGSWASSQYRWAPTADWLGGEPETPDPDDAHLELTRRWLHSFGPALETDLKWWTGWSLRGARSALEAAGAEAVEMETAGAGSTAWIGPDDDDVPPAEPWVALLPALDPTTMGWKDRSWYIDDSHVPALFDRNGNGGPTVWVDGRIVGGWAQRPDGTIVHRLLEPVDAGALEALEAAARKLREVIGEVRFKPRFPAPLQRDILG